MTLTLLDHSAELSLGDSTDNWIEIDQEIYELAVERIGEASTQGGLFG